MANFKFLSFRKAWIFLKSTIFLGWILRRSPLSFIRGGVAQGGNRLCNVFPVGRNFYEKGVERVFFEGGRFRNLRRSIGGRGNGEIFDLSVQGRIILRRSKGGEGELVRSWISASKTGVSCIEWLEGGEELTRFLVSSVRECLLIKKGLFLSKSKVCLQGKSFLLGLV